ncbi:mCG133596, isoform CRA_a, partial [Mus musculus]
DPPSLPQCVPFTISQAREAMLQITEWRFLARDEGESAVAEDPTWGEDEEPLACTTDSWAQGSVPVLHTPAPVCVEEQFHNEEPGNPDQFLLGSSWDKESQKPTQPSEPSAEPKVTPRPTATLEAFEEAEPGDALEVPHGQEGSHMLAVPSKESLRSTAEGERVYSPQSSLKQPQVVRLQASEKESSFGSHLSLEDLYLCMPQPDAAGDRLSLQSKGQLHSSPIGSESHLGALTPAEPSAFQEPEVLGERPKHKTTTLRMDSSRLPRHWVRPVAEVLIPDLEVHPLEIYRGRPRRSQAGTATSACESQALSSRAPSKPHVSSPRFPLQRCATFRALGPDPSLNLAQTSPSFGSNVPFLSPGFRFLPRNPIPPDVASTPTPKLWPLAKWPSGWEREAEQLGELWAGRTRVPPQGQEPVEVTPLEEDSGWPLAAPQVLEATSQVLWKPMVISETMKLVPGVSMWNRGTQELLNPAVIRKEAEEGTPQAPEQQPIQTGVSKPQVIMKQIRNETPKAWLLPTKPVPHSGS